LRDGTPERRFLGTVIAELTHLFEEITVMSLAVDHAAVEALSNPIRGVR
jgi:hypothetical protein